MKEVLVLRYLVAFEEDISARENGGAKESVLHETNYRGVLLRRDDLARYQHDLGNLRTSFHILRSVQVHLVSIEIGVVRSGTREIETEGGVGEYLHAMAHHGHFVKRGLTVEDNIITIAKMSFNTITVAQMDITAVLHEAKIIAIAVLANDV